MGLPNFFLPQTLPDKEKFLLTFFEEFIAQQVFSVNGVNFTDLSRDKFDKFVVGLERLSCNIHIYSFGSFLVSNVHFLLHCTCLF